MRLINKLILSALLLVLYLSAFAQKPVHVWQMQELTFNATNAYKNPYTEVKMWVELSGPGFNKKVFGFWDGENTFKVRVVAMKPGEWT